MSLAGDFLKALQPVLVRLDPSPSFKSGAANGDIVRNFRGLLVHGQGDLAAIASFRGGSVYREALGMAPRHSSGTPRQRMAAGADEMLDLTVPPGGTLLAGQRPDYEVMACGWMPMDVDTFAMASNGTPNQGVSHTYVGVGG